MADHITSAQYKLGVDIGHALCAAIGSWATHDHVIATLEHCLTVARCNRDMGIPEAAFVAPAFPTKG